MPYDNTCKYIAEHFALDLATWLRGEPIPLTTLSHTQDPEKVLQEVAYLIEQLGNPQLKGDIAALA